MLLSLTGSAIACLPWILFGSLRLPAALGPQALLLMPAPWGNDAESAIGTIANSLCRSLINSRAFNDALRGSPAKTAAKLCALTCSNTSRRSRMALLPRE